MIYLRDSVRGGRGERGRDAPNTDIVSHGLLAPRHQGMFGAYSVEKSFLNSPFQFNKVTRKGADGLSAGGGANQ